VGRDLQPVKDVKGGGSVKGKSKPNTGGTHSARAAVNFPAGNVIETHEHKGDFKEC
jgi:hypothetical protein